MSVEEKDLFGQDDALGGTGGRIETESINRMTKKSVDVGIN